MKDVRVWFNHWFSAAYLIINQLKDDRDINFIVIGSNTNDNSVYRAVCDEWFKESRYDNADTYVDYCLDFCRQHNINVFVPRRNMMAISQRINEFDDINVAVLAERKYDLVFAFNDKAQTYKLLNETGFGYVPPYALANSVKEYEAAYKAIKTNSNRVCFKYCVDEGAVSFRVVDERAEHCFNERIGSKITYADSVTALSKMSVFPKLIVMPYLSGPEISVDCLSMPNGAHIAIPRFKSQGRCETVRYDKQAIDACCSFLDTFRLTCPCNLQFRYNNEELCLLEVNTRMAGGLPYSYAASGINIPNIAVNRLLGIEKTAAWDQKTAVVSRIETPVVLES